MYQKRLSAPKHYYVEKKGEKYVVRHQGAHPKDNSIPIVMLLRDVFGYAESKNEVKRILKEEKVKIDGVARKDVKFPVGLMDPVTINGTEKSSYRVLLGKDELNFIEIPDDEDNLKLVKITGKKTIKGGKHQYNLHDGNNIVSEDDYQKGSCLLISLPEKEVKKELRLEKGNLALVTGGRHIGETSEIKKRIKNDEAENRVKLEGFETVEANIFPVGKDEPEVTLNGE